MVCGSSYISSYLSIVVRRASYLVMCFVSLERLYAILRPFHIREFFLTRYPVAVTVFSYLFCGIWHIFMLTKSSIKPVSADRLSLRTRLLFLSVFVSRVRNVFVLSNRCNAKNDSATVTPQSSCLFFTQNLNSFAAPPPLFLT